MRTFLTLLLVCFAGQQVSVPCCAEVYWEPTWSETKALADVVVLGEWVSAERLPPRDPDNRNPGLTTFKVLEIVKDSTNSFQSTEITLKHYYPGKPGEMAVLLGDRLPEFKWYKPVPVTKAAFQYIKAIPQSKIPGDQRLAFFVQYLEHPEELIAEDAYRDLHRTPFKEIQKISDKLPREKLRGWVADKNTDADRIGLYAQMLGACGNEQDARLLKAIIKQPVKKNDFRVGIYGIMCGYLLLKGEQGLKLLEETKLKAAAKAPFSETYNAMQAVTFAWDYADSIPKDRFKQSMRLLLDNPNFADLAINQLTRWKDWEVQNKVAALYDTKAFKVPSYRRAIVTYLLTCSKDSAENADGNPDREHAMTAEKHLGELRKKDPETVKKAERYFRLFNQ